MHEQQQISELKYLVIFLTVSILTGCAERPIDTNKPFAMYLNKREYSDKLKEPFAFLQLIETGGYAELETRCLIVFPSSFPGSGPVPHGGIEISFNPAKIKTGIPLNFADDMMKHSLLELDYYPKQGRNISQGKILTFSVRPSEGGNASLRFDRDTFSRFAGKAG